jgi:hypothetical protein
MASGSSYAEALSRLFDDSKDLNFGIQLTPSEIVAYLSKIIFATANSDNPEELRAALFVSKDGECGFICSKDLTYSDYKSLVQQFSAFVLSLPQDVSKHLWCKVQKNNKPVQRLAKRLGFKLDSLTESTNYYLYGG